MPRIQLRYLLSALSILAASVVIGTVRHARAPAPHNTQHTSATTLRPPREQPLKPPVPSFADGTRALVPGHRLVALYGTPSMPVLGALGEQSLEATIARAKAVAAAYQPLSAEPVMPTLEIIATVASASPTENGDYSQEISADDLRPWITAAREAGVYVILDLQPGRSDFLTQAKQYESLLRQPHVGLALDPEWRLAPDQVHLVQIGSVGIDEVNAVAAWLAGVARDSDSPQKALLLHQFRLSMIRDRAQLNTSYQELSYLIQMDGQGAQNVKQDTWRTLWQDAPKNVFFGWKNFFDEDKPMLTPAGTMQVAPQPWYISYQ